jgi:hypothetical protein
MQNAFVFVGRVDDDTAAIVKALVATNGMVVEDARELLEQRGHGITTDDDKSRREALRVIAGDRDREVG